MDESKAIVSTLRVLGLVVLILGTVLSCWAALNLGAAVAIVGALGTVVLWTVLRVLGKILETQIRKA